MLSLFLFLLGFVTIVFIAKWNRSVTLFWLMLLSYVAGIIGSKTAEALSTSNDTKQSNAYVVTKANPTQLCYVNLFDALYTPENETFTRSRSGIEGLDTNLALVITHMHRIVSSSCIRGHPSYLNTS